MERKSALKITTPSDREMALMRDFAAPRKLVWDAMTKPELIKRWLWGPDGWTMSTCTVDFRVGGAYRYEWTHSDGRHLATGGIYKEIAAPERFVATERFDDPWYKGEALITYAFIEKSGNTAMTMTMLYLSKEVRDMALKSGMEKGIEPSYARLDAILKGKGA